ncbi:MAG TPA: penicillin acylase family protein [Chitinophagaceae bacterium]|nr:penicillin acylase family protein [Chitinophagaceae bacterium]
MRIMHFLISAVITGGLVYALNKPWGDNVPMPLGKFLSPQFGIWQNAEQSDCDFNAELKLEGLNGKVEVIFDERLVPHVFADDDGDAAYVQGWLHARFRLWQMEFQTHAAAGRVSEIIGDRALAYDRTKRRLGMVYAAENMLKEIEANPLTKKAVDSYTAGVNVYINSLKESQLPVEYKLLNYKPEQWTNLKTALFIKQMTETLAGSVDDLPLTNAKGFFSDEEIQILFPQVPDSLSPIIPKGTLFEQPTVVPVKPANADSIYLGKKDTAMFADLYQPNPNNGSNNWAVSGSKTRSGAPILCNDPHLDLSLPAIWYEMQVTTSTMNAYGVSFPGIPGIVIGFNDSVAFGFTNSQRDVRDYFDIRFKDDSRQQYWFDSSWKDAVMRPETIKIKGKADFVDSVAYTVFGPVMYDKTFPADTISFKEKNLALRWSAHDASNELLMWYYLDRAKNYDDYYHALQYFTCPSQNMVFASKRGDIAIWQQGRMPALWDRQGVYVMPGLDSSYMWQGYIPMNENPHVINPERGFVSSANQRPVDTAYPYFIPGKYDLYRGYTINQRLSEMQQITPQDMMNLHNENYNSFAQMMRPILLKYVDESTLNADEKKMVNMTRNWNLKNDYDEKGATVYQAWFDSLEVLVWKDELGKAKGLYPTERTLVEALLRDSSFKYIDDVNTPEKETLNEMVTIAIKKATPGLLDEDKEDNLAWGKHKNTTIYHLLRTSAMPFARPSLPVGGGQHIINATQHSHGPSWKMIVHLTDKIEAYGVYPGGQSGNPGSKYYDSFVDQWAHGKYFELWFMHAGDKLDQRAKWKMTFQKI